MLRLGTVVALVTLAVGCSSDDGTSLCARMSEELSEIDSEADALGEQSFDNVLRLQELQTERTQVRREMVEAGCEQPAP